MKTKILAVSMLSTALLLAACGNGSNEETSAANETEETVKSEQTEEVEPAEQEETEESSQTSEYLNPLLEETEGTIESIYKNESPQYTHSLDGFNISVNQYEMTKITDMNQDYASYFNDEVNGYVVSAEVTLENTTDKNLYYNNFHKIQLENELDYINSESKNLIPEDQQIQKLRKNQDEISLYEAGEKVTGLITFILTEAEFEKMKTVTPKYIIEGGIADNKDYSGSNLENSPAYDFVYAGEQASAVADQPSLYQDRLTTDNWADKTILFEEEGINETKQIGDVTVTLEGVQYTDVVPTDANASMFTDFGDSGIVALTVKLNIDNQSDSAVNISNLGTMLDVDDSRARYLNVAQAEPRDPREIAAGEAGEKYHVFLFRKDEFSIYKKFTMEFGPFYLESGEKAFKGEQAIFELPNPHQ
ncbi:DUF5068 domain-containing protein [Cytobacillus gottheilii]|uniref:DUF5068 domain-containing protein n=1 Tax=Cytobacillus gottheilii TaxID=859144 RepID=UPI000B241757|nr:DUF5068 domain-containing protein [Cytobacillus gottheilii]